MFECFFPKRNDNFKSLRLVNRQQLLQEALISSENKHINDFITKDQHKELNEYIKNKVGWDYIKIIEDQTLLYIMFYLIKYEKVYPVLLNKIFEEVKSRKILYPNFIF